MTVPRPDLELVVKLYGSALPDYVFFLRKFESEGGWIRFSPRLREMMTRLKFYNYPELYQDEARIQTAFLRAMFDTDDEIKELIAEFETSSVEDLSQMLNQSAQEGIELGQWIDENLLHLDDWDWSPAAQAKAKTEWEKLTPEEQQRNIRKFQCSFSFSLASFFNFFALMVHGRKLTQLVTEAMAGNDDSFLRAIHIDKNILLQIPYFKDRFEQAQQEGNQKFLKAVGYRLQSPQLRGKVRHRLLFMLFAILDATHWLNDLKHREILDICEDLKFDHYGNRIETENALTKRLIEYREYKKFNTMSMP